jgi:hypothetical protein
MHTKENRIKKIEQRGCKMKIFFFFLFSFFFSLSTQAQCAMCRAALESEGGGVKAEAVNDGIVYLMAIPYISTFSNSKSFKVPFTKTPFIGE